MKNEDVLKKVVHFPEVVPTKGNRTSAFNEVQPIELPSNERLDGQTDILPGSIPGRVITQGTLDEFNLAFPVHAANLLSDKYSTFEYFDNADSVGIVTDAADGTATCTTAEKYAQSRCLKVQTEDSDGALTLSLADTSGIFSGYYVPVKIGTKYIVSCWAKSSNTARFRFVIYGNDSTNYLTSDGDVPITAVWRRYYADFTTGLTTTAVKVAIQITSSSE